MPKRLCGRHRAVTVGVLSFLGRRDLGVDVGVGVGVGVDLDLEVEVEVNLDIDIDVDVDIDPKRRGGGCMHKGAGTGLVA